MIKVTIRQSQLPRVLADIKLRRITAKIKAYEDFIRYRIKDHFSLNNTMNYPIRPNKIEYNTWKTIHGFGNITLVKTGKLKNDVLSFTRVVVNPRSGKVQLKFHVPKYGSYLIKMKKNWKTLNGADKKYIKQREKIWLKRSYRKIT